MEAIEEVNYPMNTEGIFFFFFSPYSGERN